jgi:hypothetical protein
VAELEPSELRRNQDVNELRFIFQTELQEINAATMINTLVGLAGVIEGINEGLSTGRRIDIRIKALEGGSFIVDLEILTTALESIKNLFAASDEATITTIIASFLGILKLAKSMQGEKPKVLEEHPPSSQMGSPIVTLENSKGNRVSIDARSYNLYVNIPEIRRGLKIAADAVANDSEVRGFQIQDRNRHEVFSATREEFQALGPPSEKEDVTRIVSRRENLGIIKASFDPRYTWDFLLMGAKISARMQDEAFMALVSLREKQFGAGDVLDVDLDYIQVWDETLQAYVTRQYRVTQVHNHISGPHQYTFGEYIEE